MQILMERLKEMGINEPTEEQKEQHHTQIIQEIKDSATQKKRKWENMNLLAKELREIVVQKYCENPLLVDGRKFDLRAYMIVVCMKPYLVLYQPGYVRMSLNPYTTEDFGKDTKMTHLTNNSVQKSHPDYKNLKEKSIISIEALI